MATVPFRARASRLLISIVLVGSGLAAVSAASQSASAAFDLSRVTPVFNGGSDSNNDGGQMGYSVATSGALAAVGVPEANYGGFYHIGTVYLFVRTGTDWKLLRNFFPFGYNNNLRFGESVSLAGSYLFIGIPGDNQNGAGAGAVEVEKVSTTTTNRIDILRPPAGAAAAHFGAAVSVDGTTALVGSPGAGSGAADLYLLASNHWTWKSRTTPTGLSASAQFGASVDIDGGYALVGAPNDASGAGSVGGYQRSGNNLVQQASLASLTPQAGSHFGAKVSLDAAYGAVTQPDWSAGGSFGTVQLIQRTGAVWAVKTYLQGGVGEHFGQGADISGSVVVVAGDDTITPYTRSGTVYNTGIRTDISPDSFGATGGGVAIAGSYVVYGTPTSIGPGNEPNVGAAGMLFKSGANWLIQNRIQVPVPQVNEQFGYSSATDGKRYLVVGAPGKAGLGFGSGAAYVQRSDGQLLWSFQQRLVGDSPATGDGFGASVATDGKVIVVGAPGDDGNGVVYVYTLSGTNFVRQARLSAPTGVTNFGAHVAYSANAIAVSAPGNASTPGAVVLYVKANTVWNKQVTLTDQDFSGPGDEFGAGVGLSGAYLVVGSPNSGGYGQAYVYQHSGATWPLKATLTGIGGVPGDRFGAAVAIDGTRVVVGAPGTDFIGTDTGAAFVFLRTNTTWADHQDLYPATTDTFGSFGSAVAILGTEVVVGAPSGTGTTSGSGFIEEFRNSTAGTLVTPLSSDAAMGCGHSVAIVNVPNLYVAAFAGCPQMSFPATSGSGGGYVYWDQNF